MIRLTHDPIDHAALTESVRRPGCGAVVTFLGTVRDLTGDEVTVALDYEAYPPMAEKKMAEIEADTRARWPVGEIALVHRLGRLEVGEVSVAVAVSSPHRAEAFDACRHAIDRLKELVPIWKKENGPTGIRAGSIRPGLRVKLGRRGTCGDDLAISPAIDRDAGRRASQSAAPSTTGKLIDTFGRVHNNLRISVTDRCNLRCTYCMPEDVTFRPKAELLTFEEIAHFVRVAAPLGIDKVRLTGGEPLMRRDLPKLVRMLAAIPGIADVGLTTNGLLLADQAKALFDAGLRRLNVSLDTLDPGRFRTTDPPRRAGPGARRPDGGSRGRVSTDQGERRQHPRRHRAGRRAAGPLLPRATASSCGSSSTCRSAPSRGSATRCFRPRDPRPARPRGRPARPGRGLRPAGPGDGLRLRRRRRPGRHHRVGVAAVLPAAATASA